MFSRALFKQSCKANWLMWLIITFASCFMLVCLMTIAGGGNLGDVTSGITNTMVESSIEAEGKMRASTYYNLVQPSLETFDNTFLNTYQQSYSKIKAEHPELPEEIVQSQAQTLALMAATGAVNDYVELICSKSGYEDGSVEKMEIQGLMFTCLNLDMNGDGSGDFDYFYEDFGKDIQPYTTMLGSVASLDRAKERKAYAKNYASTFFAGNMVGDTNIEQVLNALEKFDITREDYEKLTYTNEAGEQVSKFTGMTGYEYLKALAIDTIVKFDAVLEYKLSQITIDPIENPELYATEVAKITASLIEENGKSFLNSLPDSVSASLEELGSMDLFSLIVGSIYFKMAGLLLPIIYIIMVANNLIAGQVDSGAMAYVLSTSTKRKQVVFTQAMFLILSLFAMFSIVTVVGMVTLVCINNKMITMSLAQFALLNLGTFVTLFAMSGISFLASCWFNRGKRSMSVGGGLNMFFLVSSMLGLFGSKVLPSVVRIDSLSFFNYCTIISLFDEVSILAGTTAFIWKLAILLVGGIACYIIGGIKFRKKDLPL